MSTNWWIDAGLLFALAIVVFAIYKLSTREFLAAQQESNNDKQWEAWGKESVFFPAKLIRFSGFVPDRVFFFYVAVKVALVLLLPVLFVELSGQAIKWWQPLLIAIASFFLVDLYLHFRAKARKQKIQNSVSYFIDLLVAFLKSGLSLTESFERVASHGLPKSTPLAKEVALLVTEMKVGQDWQKGFEKLAQRTGAQELQRLSLLMRVGHSTGAPLVKSLSDFADLLREAQAERVNTLLNKKSLEALIPTLLLGMPVFLVLVFFPTGVQIYEAFSMFKTNW